MEIVTEMLRKYVDENAHSALNQTEYEEKYKALAERYESIKKGIEGISEKRLELSAKREKIADFMKKLESRESLVTDFDDELWKGAVEKVIVNTGGNITFAFKDGMNLEWNI